MLVRFRNAQSKQDMTEVIGHQGHQGRFAPWCWERQCHTFCELLGQSWQEVAQDKAKWLKHRADWISYMIRGKVALQELVAPV